MGRAEVNQACNDPDPETTNCTVALGVIKGKDVFVSGGVPWVFERFESQDPPQKGKSKAQEITVLFPWSGWIVDPALDTVAPEGIGDEKNPLTKYEGFLGHIFVT